MNPETKEENQFLSRLEERLDTSLTGGLPLDLVFIDNKRMASEVPTHELNALVTCGLFILKRIFTLDAHKLQLTLKVQNKLLMNFPLIVCCIERFSSFMGQFDPKKEYLELAAPVMLS